MSNPLRIQSVAFSINFSINDREQYDRYHAHSRKSQGAPKARGIRRRLARNVDVGAANGANIAQAKCPRQTNGTFSRTGKVVANPCAAAWNYWVQADAYKNNSKKADADMITYFWGQWK